MTTAAHHPGTLVVSGGAVVLEGTLVSADVVVIDGTIHEIVVGGIPGGSMPAGAARFDGSDRIVSPGFIDLQCNGAVGTDITADIGAAAIERVARALPRFGVTAFLPTVVTSTVDVRRAAIDAIGPARAATNGVGASPLGLHLEGPLISPARLGAHDGAHAGAPSPAEIDTWIDSGEVAMVTLAPEASGAIALISTLAAAGVVVAAGHTAMTPSDFDAARRAGLGYVTHLFNAMAPFDHRAPGPIGAVLADSDVIAGLICDGLHVDPVAVRMAWNALGPRRLSLVSDASAALGAPHGHFPLGGVEVVHDDSGVRTLDGVLAGSALPLDRAVRNLVAFTGCSLVEAIGTVTATPATVLGSTDRGRLAAGARGDMTILDGSGELAATIIGGSVAWTAT